MNEEESLSSFIYRLSIENLLDSINPIGNALGIKWWEMPLNLFDEVACRKISSLSGIHKNVLYSKSYHALLNGMSEKEIKMWFHRTKIKYCPKCLADKKIHRYLWGLKPICICLKHKQILINECPGCKNQVYMKALINGRCGYCNLHLERGESFKVNENDFIYLSQNQFQQLIIGNKKTAIRGLSPTKLMSLFDSMFRLFDGFESFINTNVSHLGNKVKYKPGNQLEMSVSIANIYWMLFEDFPNNFLYSLDTFYKSDSPRKKYRKRLFSNFISTHCEFDFIKKEFESYKETQIKNGLVPRNIETFDESSALKLKQMYYTKKDIYQKFNISRGEIAKLCNKNLLNPKKVVVEAHTNYYFDKHETEKILETYLKKENNLITKKEAANFLGVSVEAMVHLIEKDLIIQQEAFIKKQYPYISKESVIYLIQQLSKNVKPINYDDTKRFIVYQECLNKYVTSGLQIAKLLQWAISEEINVYSLNVDIKINQLLFDEKEIKKLLQKEDIENNGYNLGDVSKVLGFTDRTLHKMIQAKLIVPIGVSISKNGRRIYFFDKEHIDEFKEAYISPVAAASKYNVNYSMLNKYSHKKVLKNYMNGICQKTLFKKEELEEILMRKGYILRGNR
ncbi:TniQ family protein [Bacillus salipaludis]|uniref:TniQ family protein n=1 Tax=Bacillus salipaludis TaxID=2547811 RepID=UPI0022A6F917|nr:TniQ family protein [Bacillus salipaludis]